MSLELRVQVEFDQRTEGPTAMLFDGWYKFQEQVIDWHFPDSKRAAPHPLIGVVPDENRVHRGMYLSVGPLGWPHWITLNPMAFPTAADAAETIVHELAHWHCDVAGWAKVKGHGPLWQATIAGCGIVTDEDNGKHIGYSSEWHDLYALALDLSLDKILLS
jgi:hypothetical protein